MRRLPRPRLLPALIGTLALLLCLKLGGLGAAAVEILFAGPRTLVAPAQAVAAPAAAQPATGAPQPAEPVRPGPPQAASRPNPPAPRAESGTPECEVPPTAAAERALLEALRARRLELDRREQSVADREVVLAAAERRLTERVDALAALQRTLESAEQARTEREESGWKQMVKLYEGMRPRDAATIFDELDMPVLVQILHRMGERKAAPVLGAMRPDRARVVTAELARHRAPPGP
jgi:flagellar motility protein MotE (MotC chaperone)